MEVVISDFGYVLKEEPTGFIEDWVRGMRG